MDVFRALFGFRGRLNRTQYAAVFFVAYVGPLVFLIAYESSIGEVRGGLAYLALVIFMMWMQLSALAKRFHDIEQSGWMSLLLFVPILGLFAPPVMLFMRGTDGPNAYGPPP
jgi:uncharacterized membrane protein YhaH (DUF805 family)